MTNLTSKRRMLLLLLAVAAVLVPLAAWAGARGTYETMIFFNADGSGHAMGQLGSVRNSADPTESIGCSTMADLSSMTPTSYCTVVNAQGREVFSCPITNAAMVSVVQNLGSDGLLWLYWNSAGTCTKVIVMHGSDFAPKNP